jgi:hypothetical protein
LPCVGSRATRVVIVKLVFAPRTIRRREVCSGFATAQGHVLCGDAYPRSASEKISEIARFIHIFTIAISVSPDTHGSPYLVDGLQ